MSETTAMQIVENARKYRFLRLPTDGEALKALKTLSKYCGFVSCVDCKIKKIVHCDHDKEWSEGLMAIPMYWDSKLLKKLEKEEANANVECAANGGN